MDEDAKWNLKKLAKEMGEYYDFSELPTVVFIDTKPVVYDGNRRMVLAKIKHHLVSVPENDIVIPEIPDVIPCNVCSENIALQNVYRKHAESGSWDPLERDIFVHKFMHKEKSIFLAFDEATHGFISNNKIMNQRFVRDEILTSSGLKLLGISVENSQLQTTHNEEELKTILQDLLEKIRTKEISTRNRRGKILEVLDVRSRELIDKNKNNQYHVIPTFMDGKIKDNNETNGKEASQKRTPRVASTKPLFFGKVLSLKKGDVNNLYRDISEMHAYYIANKPHFSDSFHSIIRMALRLLCEAASNELGLSIDDYIKKYYSLAKKKLSQDEKTFLQTNNVTDNTLVQLLHIGAHDYTATRSYDQTLGISIILGAMLSISHGKD